MPYVHCDCRGVFLDCQLCAGTGIVWTGEQVATAAAIPPPPRVWIDEDIPPPPPPRDGRPITDLWVDAPMVRAREWSKYIGGPSVDRYAVLLDIVRSLHTRLRQCMDDESVASVQEALTHFEAQCEREKIELFVLRGK